MGWREDIKALPASFRGVPFKTTDADVKVGRRTVVHQFPGRDRPYVEDLGRSADRWQVRGYVIGEDYLDQRDALIEALSAKGPGELVHPRYGVLQVSVTGHASVEESNKDGGIARFSIDFVESGSNVFPAAREDTVDVVDQAAARCEAAAQVQFVEVMNLAGPASVLQGAINAASTTLSGVMDVVRQVTASASLSGLVSTVSGLSGSLATVIRTPAAFAEQLLGVNTLLVEGVRRPVTAVQQLGALFDASARPAITALAGSTRERIQLNGHAHSDLVRGFSLTSQARMVSLAIGGSDVDLAGNPLDERPIATASQAVALRDQLFTQIDTELEVNDPAPEMANALEGLRAAVARDVSARAELLRERSTFVPQTALPALALAHRLYQDATRVDELVARNGLRHPGLVPADPLEVLQ
ncbi:MAG: DNA circularization N-terminal domain-containing protein [Burkholderiales bacterium]|nr:DNA circularization N-terminal domain-containing protein [Burkholderiales bacterium]